MTDRMRKKNALTDRLRGRGKRGAPTDTDADRQTTRQRCRDRENEKERWTDPEVEKIKQAHQQIRTQTDRQPGNGAALNPHSSPPQTTQTVLITENAIISSSATVAW